MALSPESAADLVERARAGDVVAWDGLVEAYAPLVWAVARNHRLSPGDAGDVSQTTWMRLVEHIDRLEDPRRVGPWLATTARRECLRVLRLAGRQVLMDDDQLDRAGVAQPAADVSLLREEEAAAVRAAVERMPPRCQELLGVLLVESPPSYEELSVALHMPLGSIGPTRGRCLAKLRALVALQGVTVGA